MTLGGCPLSIFCSRGTPPTINSRYRSKRALEPSVECHREREFFVDNLLVRIHLIIEIISVDRPCAMGV